MTFWEWLDRRWPGERGWIVALLAILIGTLLKMADHDPTLWEVELFKTLLTATIITGALNMVLPFHFAANKTDEQKTANTGKLADMAKAALEAGPTGTDADALKPGDTVTLDKPVDDPEPNP